MTLASLRDRLFVSVEWIAALIAARPGPALTAALMVWIVSLALAVWIF